ncbi:unnamed protein product [Protopolystoma xenopodis]|uniref:Uncharacterized protein n=1 Tax=Protopolystoma xenopodis TaxID=117903 RepID=A0A448WZA4_9PLAT|nr:unnamed protein product [Protopolystoma xenopodis]
MVSGSDDVRHMTDQCSARSHRCCTTVSRGFLREFDRQTPKATPQRYLERPIYISLWPVFSNEMKGTPISIYKGSGTQTFPSRGGLFQLQFFHGALP